MTKIGLVTFLNCLFFLFSLPSACGQKRTLTIDDFFNSVEIRSIQLSPDGDDVIVETVRADWASNRFRNDLWLYREVGGGSLVLLTPSGHADGAQWSPDGRFVAFLSDREAPIAESKASNRRKRENIVNTVVQVYVVPARGGGAFPISFGDEDVHSFAWSADSHRIYFATRNQWTKNQKDEHKKEWSDVIQFRESERGDTVFGVEVDFATPRAMVNANRPARPPEPTAIATTPYRIDQMAASPDGHVLAFATTSRSGRIESSEPYGIYVIDLPDGGAPRLVLHTLGPPDPWASANDAWSVDSRQIFFSYGFGRPEGPIEFAQNRLYTVPVLAATSIRLTSAFGGNLEGYAVANDGSIICAARLGTEVKPFVLGAKSEVSQRRAWSGTYEHFSASRRTPRVAFVFSSIQQPTEVYLADGPDKLEMAHPITAFNKLFTEYELPKGKPYHWTTDDGIDVEGMLIYPPGQFEAKQLPMLTLIHGGPQEADGNHFEADWYQWSALAATQGWLVFQPNYRGSVGYGDAFALGLVGNVGFRPGRDILQGVDALVRDGVADSERLTVGGYSFGGYLTNWLITQTARFNAAITGAGDAEFVVNWGNNKLSLPYAYSLGGLPWEAEPNYNAQAPIWQIGKVTTPTHIVAGAEDITVYVGEDYLLERALTTRGIPNTLLIFPGEGHLLDANPWHGKIKVREELTWLEKYGGKSPPHFP